jgi:hypothetical protein
MCAQIHGDDCARRGDPSSTPVTGGCCPGYLVILFGLDSISRDHIVHGWNLLSPFADLAELLHPALQAQGVDAIAYPNTLERAASISQGIIACLVVSRLQTR